MKKLTQILIGIAIAVVFIWVFSFISGLLFWGLVAAVLGTAVFLAVKKMIKKDKSVSDPKGLLEIPEENDIERILKEMERMAGKS